MALRIPCFLAPSGNEDPDSGRAGLHVAPAFFFGPCLLVRPRLLALDLSPSCTSGPAGGWPRKRRQGKPDLHPQYSPYNNSLDYQTNGKVTPRSDLGRFSACLRVRENMFAHAFSLFLTVDLHLLTENIFVPLSLVPRSRTHSSAPRSQISARLWQCCRSQGKHANRESPWV